MERVDGGEALPAHLQGAILALGNFDGFHRGHQAVAGRAIELARELGCPAIIATFDPHPVRFFRPDAPPFRLTTLDQRQRHFEAAGADAMMVLRFDDKLSKVSAEDFVEDWLIGRAHARGVVTGQDFTFGKGKGGNVELLQRLGGARGMIAEAVGPVSDDGGIVSSSRIRESLKAGDCATATALLTRPFAIEGVVQHGDKNGRKLGYPTANIDIGPYLRPRYGVYAVKGRMADGRILDGAANLGVRPQFDPPKELLEPHFFDFSGELYGQRIEVEFHAFLRPEARFESLDALMAQMAVDCERAKSLLSSVQG